MRTRSQRNRERSSTKKLIHFTRFDFGLAKCGEAEKIVMTQREEEAVYSEDEAVSYDVPMNLDPRARIMLCPVVGCRVSSFLSRSISEGGV
jgi:hypothetical protein